VRRSIRRWRQPAGIQPDLMSHRAESRRWFYGTPWEHVQDAWRQSPLAGAAHARHPFCCCKAKPTEPILWGRAWKCIARAQIDGLMGAMEFRLSENEITEIVANPHVALHLVRGVVKTMGVRR
jgi:hypothetical protein